MTLHREKMIEQKTKRITVTGGRGFLGKHLVRLLMEKRGCQNVLVADLPEYDLRKLEDLKRMFEDQKPDIVIHLAAVVGGIGAYQANPGKFFYDNAIMGIQLIHEACLHGIEKLVLLGTVCCYPKNTPVPFKEEYLWNGYPEETNAPYGLAKKMLLVQAQAYRREYAFNSIFLMPANLYGPEDNFSLKSSNVIPALIQKITNAIGGKALALKRIGELTSASEDKASRLKSLRFSKDAPISIWGSGSATREFLFVKDCSSAILLATENYDGPEPVNLGSGSEITIMNLATLISTIIGYRGAFKWDASMPEGQLRRALDKTKAQEKFGFIAQTSLRNGLKETIEWYLNN